MATGKEVLEGPHWHPQLTYIFAVSGINKMKIWKIWNVRIILIQDIQPTYFSIFFSPSLLKLIFS